MNQTRWPDWYATVDRAFAELRRSCDRVFLTGLSMGGGLAIRLAEQHGDAVAGLAVVNPSIASADPRMRALPVLRHLVPSVAGISSDIALPDVLEGGYEREPAARSVVAVADVAGHPGQPGAGGPAVVDLQIGRPTGWWTPPRWR